MTALIFFAAVGFHPETLADSLNRCQARKLQWESLIHSTPAAERSAVIYIVENMPLRDLKALPLSQVSQAVDLSYRARKSLSWGPRIPDAIFFDAVVPYASVTEPRQSMRAIFQARYMPLVKDTKNPGEAALLINKNLFKDYHVVYNTKRRTTDQSPPDTIAQGMATCTGLSIMLVDALRAVGVPSRLAGIDSWPGRGGNHTWVEVWSEGSWHFIGAAEPDPAGLDHGWFADEAATAIKSKPDNAIYAVTFKDTGGRFPLQWEPGISIPAVNVTDRYKKQITITPSRLLIDVTLNGVRVKANVTAVDATTGNACVVGRTLGSTADVNNFLSGDATQGQTYLVKATFGGRETQAYATAKGDTVVHLNLNKPDSSKLDSVLKRRFGQDPTESAVAAKELEKVPFNDESAEAAWSTFKDAPDPALRAEFDAKLVKTSDRTSPYLWRTVGQKPDKGWDLVIAMHGGGATPKAENDSEWHYMFDRYYRDHPEAGGYIYLALRAPNDTWNGFYDDAISPLIQRLILQFVKYEDVDPTCVDICGASHGGYGAFVIGTKIPDRFAAIFPAASAPTDGETAGENLRDVEFTYAVGEKDRAYGRVDRDREFEKMVAGWKEEYGGYEGGLQVVPGAGHLINRFEGDKTAEMVKFRRNSWPRRVIWEQTDNVLHRSYWVEALAPANHGRIEATVNDNVVVLKTLGQGEVALWLSKELVDLSKPVTIVRDGRSQTFHLDPTLATYCRGLIETGDPDLAAPVRIVIRSE
jgi:hypothetical protein